MGKIGYVYLKPRRGSRDPNTLVLYEAHDKWGDGINVVCADGRVRFITDKSKFEKLLAVGGEGLGPSKTSPRSGDNAPAD